MTKQITLQTARVKKGQRWRNRHSGEEGEVVFVGPESAGRERWTGVAILHDGEKKPMRWRLHGWRTASVASYERGVGYARLMVDGGRGDYAPGFLDCYEPVEAEGEKL